MCLVLMALPVPERVAVQVHEEVLRLLTASVGKLSARQLATYLQATLQHSRKSRKCAVKWSCLQTSACSGRPTQAT